MSADLELERSLQSHKGLYDICLEWMDNNGWMLLDQGVYTKDYQNELSVLVVGQAGGPVVSIMDDDATWVYLPGIKCESLQVFIAVMANFEAVIDYAEDLSSD